MITVFGVIDTSSLPSQSSGTVTHFAITPDSVIQLTLQRDVSEDVDLSEMNVKLVGPVGNGSFNWELAPFIGHDNAVKIHYTIYTPLAQ